MRLGVRVGVDVGSARIGVAVSDPEGVVAMPYATLQVRPTASRSGRGPGGVADDPGTALTQLVAGESAIEVIVGLPRRLDGSQGPAAEAARAFALDLARRVRGVPVRLFDERLSTVQAHRALHASGRPGRRHREVVDQVAAVTILQAALDLERESGRPPGEVVGGRKPRHGAQTMRSEGATG